MDDASASICAPFRTSTARSLRRRPPGQRSPAPSIGMIRPAACSAARLQFQIVDRKSADQPTAEDGRSKSARTRRRILDAAAHVLSRKGYAGTRLTDVADQAEIQAPAIYYYFPSRDDLIEEVMWTGIALMREHVTKVLTALTPGADPLERIDAAV